MWDNLSFWVWVFIVVVSFLARRKKKPTSIIPGGQPVDSQPAEKPISFEDLLREIQASKAPQPVVPVELPKKQVLKPVPVTSEYTDYDDEVVDEERDLEEVDYKKRDHDETVDIYEKAKLAAFNRASLEETMKVEDTEVKFGQFKGYQAELKPNLAQTYVKDLQDPDGFRKAFILSEILNRRF